MSSKDNPTIPLGFQVEDHFYGGGDPDDPKNWLKRGTVIGKGAFSGGDPNDPKNYTDTGGKLYKLEENYLDPAAKTLGHLINTARQIDIKGTRPVEALFDIGKKTSDVSNAAIGTMANLIKPGAITREEATSAFYLPNLFKPKNPIVPSLEEMAKREGIPQGPSLSQIIPVKPGGLLDPTARSFGAGVISGYSDPMNKVAPAVIGNIVKYGPRALTKDLPYNIFKTPLGALDEYSKQKNKLPLSRALFNEGIGGSEGEILSQIKKRQALFNQRRNKILERMQENGFAGDVKDAVTPALNHAEMLVNSGVTEEVLKGTQLLNEIESKYASNYTRPASLEVNPPEPSTKIKVPLENSDPSGLMNNPTYAEKIIPGKPGSFKVISGVTPASSEQMQTFKRNAWRSAYDEAAAPEIISNRKMQAAGFANQLMSGAEETPSTFWEKLTRNPVAKQLADINARQSSMLAAEKRLGSKAMTEANRPPISGVESGIVGAMTAANNNPITGALKGVGAVTIKKAGEQAKWAKFPTRVGLALQKANPFRLVPDAAYNAYEALTPAGALDMWLKQKIEESTRPKSNWENLKPNEEQEQ